MSQYQVSPVLAVGAIDTARSHTPSSDIGETGVSQILLSIARMDAILAAAPLSLSTARINSMTVNDKQFFIREAIRVGTLVTTDLLPTAIEDAADPVAQVHPYGTVWRNTTDDGVFQTPGDGTWLEVSP